MELKDRIASARKEAKLTQEQLAKAVGKTRAAVAQWESGETRPRHKTLLKIAEIVGSTSEWLLVGDRVEPNAHYQGPVEFPERRIPVYGQAVGGLDGEFILNGEHIGDVICPPFLSDVSDAYAVCVVGDSMAPRFEDGETVYVNPTRRCRAGDYVIAQVMVDEHSTPHAYIKRFVSRNTEQLVLSQFNPEKNLAFPNDKVQSVHLIVATLSE